jgi:hypothetical protein
MGEEAAIAGNGSKPLSLITYIKFHTISPLCSKIHTAGMALMLWLNG